MIQRKLYQWSLISCALTLAAPSAALAANHKSPELDPGAKKALKNQSAGRAGDSNTSTADVNAPYLEGITSASFGINMGAAFATGGQSSFSRLNLGADADYKFKNNWVGGAFFNYIPISANTATAGSVDQSLFLYGVEALYMFNKILSPGALQVGAKVGLNSYTTPSANGTPVPGGSGTTNFLWGPKVAYDYPLTHNWSVGGEGDILFTTQSNGNTLINAIGLVKYWFS